MPHGLPLRPCRGSGREGVPAPPVAQSLVVLFGITVIVFLLIHLLPGGPARALLGPTAKQYQLKRHRRERFTTSRCSCSTCIPEPPVRWGPRVFLLVQPERDRVAGPNLPSPYCCAALAIFFTLLIAIPLGIFQATRSNTVPDHIINARRSSPTPCPHSGCRRCSYSGFPSRCTGSRRRLLKATLGVALRERWQWCCP